MKSHSIFFLTLLFCSSFAVAQHETEVENLGPLVNSKYADISPIISADGQLLYFIVQGHPSNFDIKSVPSAQDIWFTTLDSSGHWTKAQHDSRVLNSCSANAVLWISPDGDKLLLKGVFANGKYIGRGISSCYKTKNGWSVPQKLNIVNYEKMDLGVFTGAVASNDGKVLISYFSKEKGSVLNDLFVSFKNEYGNWSQPKSLGVKINTKSFTEEAPFLAADGVTMYFSTNRPGGHGDNDIWMAKRLDESWTNWSDPVNLESPINTPNWDSYFTLSGSGDFAYLVTSENAIGESDIVRIRLKKNEQPNPVAIISGKVLNAKTKAPVSATLLYDRLEDGVNVGSAVSSLMDGSYKIVLPYGKNYSFRAVADKFLSVSENIKLDTLSSYKEMGKDLYLVPAEIGQTIRLNNIFFDFNKAVLREESYPELDRVVKILNDNPAMEIEMSGHTDNYGADQLNLKLSEDRAKAVTTYLISKGVSSGRIKPKGYGESKPVATNETDEGRQLNRRVEFTILKN